MPICKLSTGTGNSLGWSSTMLISVQAQCTYIILTVDPLNKKTLLRMSTKMLFAFRKTIRYYVAIFNFYVFKPVELHAGKKSMDKLYQVAFIV